MRALLGMVTVIGRVRVTGRYRQSAAGVRRHVPSAHDLDPTFLGHRAEVVQMGMYSQLGTLRCPRQAEAHVSAGGPGERGPGSTAPTGASVLSGGQQRVPLRAARPRLILLDEPSTAWTSPTGRPAVHH